MITYDYVAETSQRERVSGQVEAADEPSARTELTTRGLRVIELRPKVSVADSAMLGDEQLAVLVRAVGAASASRVPLEVALAALAEEGYDPRLAKVAGQLADQLHRGTTLNDAVVSLGPDLPAEIRGVLQAGVACGDLAGTVEQFVHQRMATQRIGRRIRVAIAYPLIILAILVPITLFLCIFVIPMFADMYEEFDMDLPPMTHVVLQAAQQMPGLIGAVLLVVVGLPMLSRIIGGRWLLHRVRSATPLLGRLWMWSGQREFAAMLASFLDLRLPMTSAVALTGESLSDRSLARACRRLSERLQSGQSLSDCLSQSIHFDRGLVALTAWGESHGLVPEALQIATDVFEDRIDQRATMLRRLLPPVALVVVAAAAFLVIVSLMIPLVRLIEGLSA